MFRKLTAALLTAGAMMVGGQYAAAHDRQVVIATGAVTGVYFPAGGAICQMINANTADHGLRCYVEASGGSVSNLMAIKTGTHAFGIAQSDWQFHAYIGSSRFQSVGPMDDLRSVFSLHAEPFTLLARRDAGIETIEDLIGKRVNLGNIGSGQRATMEVLMERYGWQTDDFEVALAIPASQQTTALCNNEIEATVYTVGHPASAIHEATISCDTVLINVTGDPITQLISTYDYYRQATIPGGLYRGNDADITTFGVGATLVTSARVPNDIVYQLTKSVFENFDEFRKLHPTFATLDPKTMVEDGLSAPLHNGAARYFREIGLMR